MTSTLRRVGWFRVVALLVAAALVVACTSSDTDDPTDDDASTDGDYQPGDDGAVNLCDYLPEEDAEALNPRDKELVSTILLGDFTYLGCTVGDVYSISFGIRVIDDGDPYEGLIGESEDLDGFGDEAKVAYERFGGETVASYTVSYFEDVVLLVRNTSIGNSDPDAQVEDERVYEAMTAFVEALPDDIVERSLSAVVDADVCPDVESEVVTALAGDVVLARGGHADDADRCAYRGDDGTQIRVSSWARDQPVDYEPIGEPISLPNIDGADAFVDDTGESVRLAIISAGERLSIIQVISDDGDKVDANAVVEFAEEFLTLVG